jgi:hypothetical protein
MLVILLVVVEQSRREGEGRMEQVVPPQDGIGAIPFDPGHPLVPVSRVPVLTSPSVHQSLLIFGYRCCGQRCSRLSIEAW